MRKEARKWLDHDNISWTFFVHIESWYLLSFYLHIHKHMRSLINNRANTQKEKNYYYSAWLTMNKIDQNAACFFFHSLPYDLIANSCRLVYTQLCFSPSWWPTGNPRGSEILHQKEEKNVNQTTCSILVSYRM